jgi:hypothetical protein
MLVSKDLIIPIETSSCLKCGRYILPDQNVDIFVSNNGKIYCIEICWLCSKGLFRCDDCISYLSSPGTLEGVCLDTPRGETKRYHEQCDHFTQSRPFTLEEINKGEKS